MEQQQHNQRPATCTKLKEDMQAVKGESPIIYVNVFYNISSLMQIMTTRGMIKFAMFANDSKRLRKLSYSKTLKD
uniref:Uncharacterized protein n=1 Tax=Glossina palpalis gambiensis TaxID=67801 RepID=A0A1B0AQ43_9MUSC